MKQKIDKETQKILDILSKKEKETTVKSDFFKYAINKFKKV